MNSQMQQAKVSIDSIFALNIPRNNEPRSKITNKRQPQFEFLTKA